MGKSRKGRRQALLEEEDESEEEQEQEELLAAQPSSRSFKDLDFAERRALQRQQAADKRRAKQKCYLCGQVGHVRRECPGIPDDGRGMSRYKNKSDKAAEKQKLMERRKKRTSGSGGTSGNHEQTISELWPEYPEAFRTRLSGEEKNLVYYDVHCDVGASINYLRQGRGMAKISYKAATAEYRGALFMSNGLKAMLSQTVLMKPGRPWTNPLPSELVQSHQDESETGEEGFPIFFVLSLSSAFTLGSMEMKDEAIESLVTTVKDHSNLILAVGANLDYNREAVKLPGMDVESQLYRFQVAWEAAGRLEVPLQLKLLPGAASLEQEGSIAGSEYATVLLAAQEQLSTAIGTFSNLAIHVVGWCGKASHMIALLQAFPHNIRAFGLDGTVTFAKAKDVHECAFDIPLEKLVIETDSIIPSQVNSRLGRSAFFHSGFWPFVAQAVADQKKTVLIHQVVHAANENALRLYPRLRPTEGEATKEMSDAPNT